MERDIEGGSESTGLATVSTSTTDCIDDDAVMPSGAGSSEAGGAIFTTRAEARCVRPVAELLAKRKKRRRCDVDRDRMHRQGFGYKDEVEPCR